MPTLIIVGISVSIFHFMYRTLIAILSYMSKLRVSSTYPFKQLPKESSYQLKRAAYDRTDGMDS